MRKKAIIFDLDNTIYPVTSIGDKLFYKLFQLIEHEGGFSGNIDKIKQEIMRKPFQLVAKDFSFGETLKFKCLTLLKDLTYNEKIEPFEDYKATKHIDCKKFLVTTGFTKLQFSKINRLGIINDFENVFVIDPMLTNLTKKEYFKIIMKNYKLQASEVLIVGDDINSEIAAGETLNIKTVLYDYENKYKKLSNQIVIDNFDELWSYI